MIKKFLCLLFFFVLISSAYPKQAAAKNIFGLHLTQTSDITKAHEIINSNGGDWGWVTIVIRVDQLDGIQWQDFFNQCRRFHIIPILRLSSKFESGKWNIPSPADIDNFSSFLNSLNWPTTEKHIILFNEMNRGDEWQGQVNPKQYADIVIYTSDRFKSLDKNFILLSGGLDLAAPHSPPNFYSADNFYREIINYKPNFFDYIDGLASHSYPNHGYIGKPSDIGRHSIKGYDWELDFLKNLKVTKNLLVFITETGWPHREGIFPNSSFYTSTTSADFLIKAINIWQQDDRIKAITPFTFNYPQEPFDHFSWLDKNNQLLKAYQKVVDTKKTNNTPTQINSYDITKIELPLIIFPNHQYQAKAYLKNLGQAIWSKNELQFCLDPQSTQNIILSKICTNSNVSTEPGQNQSIDFTFTLINDPDITKSLIGWNNIDKHYEIKPIIQSIPIYRPKTGLGQKIKSFLENVF